MLCTQTMPDYKQYTTPIDKGSGFPNDFPKLVAQYKKDFTANWNSWSSKYLITTLLQI